MAPLSQKTQKTQKSQKTQTTNLLPLRTRGVNRPTPLLTNLPTAADRAGAAVRAERRSATLSGTRVNAHAARNVGMPRVPQATLDVGWALAAQPPVPGGSESGATQIFLSYSPRRRSSLSSSLFLVLLVKWICRCPRRQSRSRGGETQPAGTASRDHHGWLVVLVVLFLVFLVKRLLGRSRRHSRWRGSEYEGLPAGTASMGAMVCPTPELKQAGSSYFPKASRHTTCNGINHFSYGCSRLWLVTPGQCSFELVEILRLLSLYAGVLSVLVRVC